MATREVLWSTLALEDLNSVFEYIARDSQFYANRLIDEVIEKVNSIPDLPFRGRITPEYREETLREVFVKQYRIIYEVTERSVIVHGVIHMARDLESFWHKELGL